MYNDYYGLRQAPFRITPDTRLFFPGGNRGAVLDALVYAITSGEGIVKVVGEVGSGKTMLCRMLEQELPASVEIVYFAMPSLAPENILHAIAFELKLPVTQVDSRLQVMNLLQEYLLQRHSENRQVVLFIEEAQGMPIATLEEIRLLSNLETQQHKLLQIVMFGQPELDEMIANREIRQLKERITYSFQLAPFRQADIRDYLNARLRTCGYRGGELFNTSAVKAIDYFSQGLLRRINILADKAMLAAYAGNNNRVTAKHVRLAARDSEFVTGLRYFNSTVPAFVLLLIAGVLWIFQMGGGMFSVPGLDAGNQHSAAAETTSIRMEKATGALTGDPTVTTIPEPALVEESPESVAEMVTGDTQPVTETLPASDAPQASPSSHVVYYYPDYESRLIVSEENKEVAGGSDGMSTDDVDQTAATGIARENPDTSDAPGEMNESQDKTYNTLVLDNTLVLEENNGTSGQLLGLNQLLELQDTADSRFTADESMLIQQLKDLPPEVTENGDIVSEEQICPLCSAIIFRPLIKPENL